MADTSQQLRARLFRRFRGVEVGWVPCVACGAQLHHTAEPRVNPNRFEVMTVVDVAGGWRTAGCLPLCAVDAPVVASWSRDETIERLSADRLDSPVEAHGTARARTMRATDGKNVSAGAVIVPEVEGFLARRETLSGVVRWSIDGLTVDPDTVHALTASAGQLSNPYHGPDGRFAPKGTGRRTGYKADKQSKDAQTRLARHLFENGGFTLGRTRNEQAVFDLAGLEEIPTGGTGGREDIPTQTAQRRPSDYSDGMDTGSGGRLPIAVVKPTVPFGEMTAEQVETLADAMYANMIAAIDVINATD